MPEQRTKERESADEVDQFLIEHIDTIPHLEALLLIWSGRNKPWTVDYMAERLFLPPQSAREILTDLAAQKLIAAGTETDSYRYKGTPERDRLLELVDITYRRELIRISRLIHSKAPASVRAFARAFRMKKGPE